MEGCWQSVGLWGKNVIDRTQVGVYFQLPNGQSGNFEKMKEVL